MDHMFIHPSTVLLIALATAGVTGAALNYFQGVGAQQPLYSDSFLIPGTDTPLETTWVIEIKEATE